MYDLHVLSWFLLTAIKNLAQTILKFLCSLILNERIQVLHKQSLDLSDSNQRVFQKFCEYLEGKSRQNIMKIRRREDKILDVA